VESLFRPADLDELFRRAAGDQYERELLFSHLVELMMAVALRQRPSVHAAYRHLKGEAAPNARLDEALARLVPISGAVPGDSMGSC
jgi:hypothetical protein